MRQQPNKLFILAFVLLSHILGLITPASASMDALHATQGNPDIAAICSGDGTIKWISLSSYYNTGKIVFVDNPESSTQQAEHAKCSTCTMSNFSDDEFDTIAIDNLSAQINKHSNPFNTLNFQRSGATNKANSRAPPHTC